MSEQKATNVRWHNSSVTRQDREKIKRHRGFTVWFTGLSASGKSTLASALEQALHKRGYHTYILDGDNIRHGLNKNLGFSPEDRQENIRRIAEVARLFRDAGIINMTAFISPYLRDREMARNLDGGEDDFIEVFVDCPLEICEQRDPKGMYQKAKRGEIPEFTGVSAPYEPPPAPEIHLRTDLMPVEACVDEILSYLVSRGYIPR